MKLFISLFVFILVLSLPACVSLSTFEEMQSQRDSLQLSVEALKNAVTSMQTRIDNLTAENSALKSQNTEKDKQISDLQTQTDTLKDRIRLLENDLHVANQNYEQSKSKNSAEIKKLLASLELLQKDVVQRELKLKDYEQALASIQRDLIGREQRVGDLERRLAVRDSTLNALKAKLNDALLGFTNSGLSINIINGRVYVSLSNQLLFSTGKADIDKRGKEALLGLAKVLNTQDDLAILVEGHTDNQAVINLGAIKDNWDLSVVRATEVIRYLVNEGKVDPRKITASGRSEYFPIDQANTAEARAKNRRTEIILIPKLSELFEILEQ